MSAHRPRAFERAISHPSGANFFSGAGHAAGNAAQNPRCMQPRIGRIVSGTFWWPRATDLSHSGPVASGGVLRGSCRRLIGPHPENALCRLRPLVATSRGSRWKASGPAASNRRRRGTSSTAISGPRWSALWPAQWWGWKTLLGSRLPQSTGGYGPGRGRH